MKRALAGMVALALVPTLMGATAVMARPKEPVVYKTILPAKENTFFDITNLYAPQIGQSLNVTKSMTWRTLQMGTNELKLVRDLDTFADLMAGKYDENWFEHHYSDFSTTADVTIEIWRHDASGPIPEAFDLSEGFTRIYQATTRHKIPIGARINFRLGGGVAVTPGRYFITVGVRFVDPRVFNLRFTGQENGTNTLGGLDHSHPVRPDCAKYKMTKDTHRGGQAYQASPETRPDAPPWEAPFTTRFHVAKTKVIMPCDIKGVYDPNAQIWNPGDVGMVFRGTVG
jgi:hypothetical protein